MKKLNVLLAVTDQLKSRFKAIISDYTVYFKTKQGAFLGERATYSAREGYIEDPGKKKYVKVVTTVKEKLDYFIDNSEEFISSLFSQEVTNASGVTAMLVVDGKEWGEFTSLELLRLKSLLEGKEYGNIEAMLIQLPVRSDAEIWVPSSEEMYSDREVFQTALQSGVSKTTVKEEYILADPNIAKGSALPAGYTPKTSINNITVEIGDYTHQKFSGEWTHKKRAEALERINKLKLAVIKALKECNEATAKDSALTSERIFGYIFYNK